MIRALVARLAPARRALLGMAALAAARVLLDAEGASDGDFDTCVFCRQSGCEDGTVVHGADCPDTTGVYPVALRGLFPHGPSYCADCREPLLPGSHFVERELEPIGGVRCVTPLCLGCGATDFMGSH